MDDSPEYAPFDAECGKILRRRGTRDGHRRAGGSSACRPEVSEKKLYRNMTESRRVWKINEQYDSLVVLLGGVVNGARKSRVWEREGKEGKLHKLDILEATTTYLRHLMEELEDVKSKNTAKGHEVRL